MRESAVRWQRRSAELAVARGELSETPALVGPCTRGAGSPATHTLSVGPTN